jgi:ParB family chromosome partitioning protein
MAARIDPKALMAKSLQRDAHDAQGAAEGNIPADVSDRYDIADSVAARKKAGLFSAATKEALPGFSAESGPQGEAGPLLRVPIENVHDNPFNARHVYDSAVVKDFASSLAVRGQQVPAPAVPHPDLSGHYILIDGHYRKRGLLAAGKREMLLQLHSATAPLDMYRRSFAINVERTPQTPLDNAIAWKNLIDQKLVESAEAIGEMLGISAANIAKAMAFLKLPESALDKIRETPAKFGLAIGYELSLCAAILPEDRLLELMDRVLREDLSSRQLAAIRASLAKPARKQKETSRQYRLRLDGKDVGVLKAWDRSGKISLEIRIADPKEREGVVDELKRRFGWDPAEGVS